MKKIISFVFFIFASLLPVFAANWKEIYPKNYVDASSVSWNKDTVSFWLKSLNSGDWKQINNKKVWYMMDYISVNCRNKQFAIKTGIYYDLQNQVIDSFNIDYDQFLEWLQVVPDTNSDIWYQIFCK